MFIRWYGMFSVVGGSHLAHDGYWMVLLSICSNIWLVLGAFWDRNPSTKSFLSFDDQILLLTCWRFIVSFNGFIWHSWAYVVSILAYLGLSILGWLYYDMELWLKWSTPLIFTHLEKYSYLFVFYCLIMWPCGHLSQVVGMYVLHAHESRVTVWWKKKERKLF